jgi:hypothetical protein
VSPNEAATYSKFGAELADALEEVAGNADLIANPTAALDVLGITVAVEVTVSLPMDPDALINAAGAIRAGAIPAFWPWIWYIPWIMLVGPGQGGQSA